MQIAVDFDDTIVNTIDLVLEIVNADRPQAYQYVKEDIKSWMMTDHLNLTYEELTAVFNEIDYNDVEEFEGAVETIQRLAADHAVSIVTANPNIDKIQSWLFWNGLGHCMLYHAKDKPAFLKKHGYDLLIDDRIETCRAMVHKNSAAAILFDRPWNQRETLVDWGIGMQERRVRRWAVMEAVVQDIAGNPNFQLTRKAVQDKARYVMGFYCNEPVVMQVDRQPESRNEYSIRPEEVPNIMALAEDIVTNEAGAKQSRIEGDYTLLPPLAVKEVAKVLKEGADKYGVDNWKGLTIDEINNHVYAHLLDYQQSANTDDLSHAACRILMALQLHIEKLAMIEALKI